MTAALLAAVLSIVPYSPTVEDRVDSIHSNFFYDGEGKVIFQQVIFEVFDMDLEEPVIIDWRLVKCKSQLPDFNHATGLWEARWVDNDVIRLVRADSYCESHTQYDPELEARSYYPKELRRGFSKK
jgi:hypothetical protein